MDDFAKGLVGDVKKVTKKWADQRRREIRDARAQSRRRDVFMRRRRVTVLDAAWEIMSTAYLKASKNGTLPVQPRQIMYAARGYIQEKTGRELEAPVLHPDHPARLHRPRRRSIGTSSGMPAVGCTSRTRTGMSDSGRLRCASTWTGRRASICRPIGPAAGRPPAPRIDIGAVLFVEKEGFLPLFRAVRLAERYDLAIMSTKGVSTTAARTLIDSLVADGVPVFCIRDFDVSGFTIAGTLGRDTRRYSWASTGAIDLGLRLEDITKYGLEREDVYYQGDGNCTLRDDRRIRRKIGAGLEKNGATEEEIEFLIHHRVELNAFTSDQLVDWIEAKLVENGVEKVVPEEETVTAAARGFVRDLIAKRYLDTFAGDIDREVDLYAASLGSLAPSVARMLEADQVLAWDDALQQIVQAHAERRS